jgi:hypothetical protein
MKNIKPNCGPSSVAHLIGVDVEETMKKFAAVNPKRYGGSRWQGYSYVPDCLAVLNNHGKTQEMTERGSLKSFVEKHTTKSGQYFLRVGGHFVAVKNQKVYDNWFAGADPADCKWSRKRVTHAYRFTANAVEQDDFHAMLERSRKAGLAIREAA